MTLPAHVQQLLDTYESKDVDAIASYLTDTYQWIGANQVLDHDRMLTLLRVYFTAFPDWQFNFSDAEFDDDVLQVTIAPTGTQTGALDLTPLGIEVQSGPTERAIALVPRHIESTFVEGRIASQHIEMVGGQGFLRELLGALSVDLPAR